MKLKTIMFALITAAILGLGGCATTPCDNCYYNYASQCGGCCNTTTTCTATYASTACPCPGYY